MKFDRIMVILIIGWATVCMTWATSNIITSLHSSYLNVNALMLLEASPRNEFGHHYIPPKPPVLPYDEDFEAQDDFLIQNP